MPDWTEDVRLRFRRDKSTPNQWLAEAWYNGRAIDVIYVRDKADAGVWFIEQGYGMPLSRGAPPPEGGPR
jgi:hypothetical protein